MNGRPKPSLLVRAVEGWVAFYTRGLPSEVRDARRAELRSDLWEHLQYASGDGHGRLRRSIQVGGRVVRGMADDLWWRFAQQAAGGSATEAAARRRHLLAWLFDWVVSPGVAIGVLLTTWFSASPLRLASALVVLFVILAVLRMKLVGPLRNESALMFGVVAHADADPGRLRRLWGGLLASVLLLVGIRSYAATLNPLLHLDGLVYLGESLVSIGILVTVLMLLNEYARRWRRQRRSRSGD
jgi:hypothetical protein